MIACGGCHYRRPLLPKDIVSLKDLHYKLFPVNYDGSFFHKVTEGMDRTCSWAAAAAPLPTFHSVYSVRFPSFGRNAEAALHEDRLVGFVTTRAVKLHEIDPADRELMGMGSPSYDDSPILYILTLGVDQVQMSLHVHMRAELRGLCMGCWG